MEPITSKVILEGFFVGIFLILIVYLVSLPIHLLNIKPNLPQICQTWNKNRVMEITIFLSGFMFHILCEISGLNTYYAKNKIMI